MSKFVPISMEIANKIRDMIFLEKRFLPGSRLPNETELMNELGVSRTSLREAVKILIASNILYIKRGTGTFVCEFENKNERIFKSFYSENDISVVKNSFEIRVILEPEMAYQSVENINDEDIENLEKLEKACAEKIKSGKDYSNEDKQFHAAIASISKNHIFEKLMPYFYVSIASIEDSISKEETDAAVKALNENALKYHKKIVDCFIRRDAAGVKIAMETHIYNSMSIFDNLIISKPKLTEF